MDTVAKFQATRHGGALTPPPSRSSPRVRPDACRSVPSPDNILFRWSISDRRPAGVGPCPCATTEELGVTDPAFPTRGGSRLMRAIRINSSAVRRPWGQELPCPATARLSSDRGGRRQLHRRLSAPGLYKNPLPYGLGLEGAGVTGGGRRRHDGARQRPVAWTGIRGRTRPTTCCQPTSSSRCPRASTRALARPHAQGMTAHYLALEYPLKAGDTCVVHAAAKGVGLLLCQMATRRGAGHRRSRPRRRRSSPARRGPTTSSSTRGRTSRRRSSA